MSDPLQVTPLPITLEHAVDRTMWLEPSSAQPRCAEHEHGGRDGAVGSEAPGATTP